MPGNPDRAGRNSNRRGRGFQASIAAEFQRAGFREAKSNPHRQGADVVGVPGLTIQAKRHKSYRVPHFDSGRRFVTPRITAEIESAWKNRALDTDLSVSIWVTPQTPAREADVYVLVADLKARGLQVMNPPGYEICRTEFGEYVLRTKLRMFAELFASIKLSH